MPWRVGTPMSARRDFIEDWLRGLYTMAELCTRYGISRRVGYEWVARFEQATPRSRYSTTGGSSL